jgi:hypothetical protein
MGFFGVAQAVFGRQIRHGPLYKRKKGGLKGFLVEIAQRKLLKNTGITMGLNFSGGQMQTLSQRIDMRLQLFALAARQCNAGAEPRMAFGLEPATASARQARPGNSFPYLREIFNQSYRRANSSVALPVAFRNICDDSLIHLFAHSSQPQALDILKQGLAAGLQPDSPNGAGQTPLMITAISGNAPGYVLLRDQLLGLLFTQDQQLAALNQRDRLGLSLLDYTVMGGMTAEINDLLERGLSPTLVPRPVPSTSQLAVCLHGQSHPITLSIQAAESALLQASSVVNRVRRLPSALP